MIQAAATMAALAIPLGDWLMPAGAAVGAATALLIRARRAKRDGPRRDGKPTRGATTR